MSIGIESPQGGKTKNAIMALIPTRARPPVKVLTQGPQLILHQNAGHTRSVLNRHAPLTRD